MIEEKPGNLEHDVCITSAGGASEGVYSGHLHGWTESRRCRTFRLRRRGPTAGGAPSNEVADPLQRSTSGDLPPRGDAGIQKCTTPYRFGCSVRKHVKKPLRRVAHRLKSVIFST